MLSRAFLIGMATLGLAIPAAAQQRGTMEFGGFASVASFDPELSLRSAYGAGGRVGMFLLPWLSVEFEKGGMKATRPHGLADVNVGILSGRVVAIPVKSGRLSFLTGVGVLASTETNFLHSYGMDVLAGVKIALTENAALRVDGVIDWLANDDWKRYQTLRVGVSLFRRPDRETVTLTVTTPAPPPVMVQAADSVSAAEIRRLRANDAALTALRDSIRTAPQLSAATISEMEAAIHFAFDQSVITPQAMAILDEKITLFRADPNMSIMITGHTDLIDTESYNMALGTRRANAAKAYLVSRGIASERILVESEGMSQPITQAPGIAGQAPNRRAMFRVVIGPDFR